MLFLLEQQTFFFICNLQIMGAKIWIFFNKKFNIVRALLMLFTTSYIVVRASFVFEIIDIFHLKVNT